MIYITCSRMHYDYETSTIWVKVYSTDCNLYFSEYNRPILQFPLRNLKGGEKNG